MAKPPKSRSEAPRAEAANLPNVAQTLVIVESPPKAKSIAKYLGDGYVVESSVGHIRDLPARAKEVPAAYKKEKWASLGIDTDNDFKPLYVVSEKSKEQVKKLKALLKDSDELVLATDKDREGEAIAWHLKEVLNPKVPVKRIVFTEVTPEAIRRAIENPGDIDYNKVEAQEARRLLDRLYGYEVSPVLWKKVRPRLSAGRVQSVATRIVVERERERMAFRSANYWDLTATFTATDTKHSAERPFSATLLELDGARVATGREFNQDGTLKKDNVVHLDERRAQALATALHSQPASVESREAKPYRRTPAPPFITSTYQQEASRKLRLGSQAAMRMAQGLYERGYITYMRTDSTTLSETALAAARSQIAEEFGAEYLPPEVRTYRKKNQAAQEAQIPVSTIAFGTEAGTIIYDDPRTDFIESDPIPVPVQEDNLRAIADQTDGAFFAASSLEELEAVYTDIGSAVGFETINREITDWFVGFGLILLTEWAGDPNLRSRFRLFEQARSEGRLWDLKTFQTSYSVPPIALVHQRGFAEFPD